MQKSFKNNRMARRDTKKWKSDEKFTMYSDYYDRDRDRDRDREQDQKDGKFNQRRVSFKIKKTGPTNRISKAYLSKLEGDEEMSEFIGGALNRQDKTKEKPKYKRVGSPIPFKISNTLGWYQVTIPYGQKYDKKAVIYFISENIKPDTLEPLYYKEEQSRSVFFIDNIRIAEKLSTLDRRILMPDGYRLIIKVRSAIPTVQMDDELKQRMKLVMSKRYNAATKALDLSKFHADEDLKGVFCGLLRPAVMLAAIDIIAENIPDLEALNLNDNLIMQCDQFKLMAEKLPCLKILYLDGNRINSIQQLNALKGMQLVELAVKRNPFMKYYRLEQAYISDIQKKFPKLRKLDGQELKPLIGFEVMDPSELPAPKRSFVVDPTGQQIVLQFVELYFSLFDRDRKPLADAYHEQAMVSLSAAVNQARLAHYTPYARNLKSYDQKVKTRQICYGKTAIMSLLNDLPRTQHDPESCTIDITLYTPKMIAFTLTGIFRELSDYPSSSKELNIRAFERSFIIVPLGSGFCIRNELILISNVTTNQLKNAFKSNEIDQQAPSTSASAAAIASPSSSIPSTSLGVTQPTPAVPNEAIKMQMIQAMSEQSKMNLEWSKKCLEETNWIFNNAIHAFNELHKQNKIPPEAFVK